MVYYNTVIGSENGKAPCSCVRQNPCPNIPACPPGPSRPATATIPFSVSQYGAELGTDAQGNPQIIYFSGFGSENNNPMYLQEGEWAGGTITFRQDSPFGSSFIMPRNAVLKNIYVLFSSKYDTSFDEGVVMYPFVCLAVSNSVNLVYTILQDTITYTEPYLGGVEYPKHTLRRASLTNLDIPIAEGTLVGIVLGVRAENADEEQQFRFTASGGILFE